LIDEKVQQSRSVCQV